MPRLRPLLLPLALILLIAAFFWKQAFTDLIVARGDTLLYFYPYWDYRGQMLRAGQLPLWNPYLFMGVPFLANSQAGVLYPLNWPLALFSAPVAVKIAVLSHLALASVGAYLFARRVLRQGHWGAFASGAVFALSGYLSAQVEHVNQLQGLSWFPWLLWAGDRALRPGPPRQTWAAIVPCGLVIALQLLAGHTQTAFISVFGLSIYAGLAVTHPPSANLEFAVGSWKFGFLSRLLRASGVILVSVLFAVLLASAQILPTLELSSLSLRGGGLSVREALSFSLHPLLLGRALLPGYSKALASEFVGYVGVLGLGLAVLGAAGWRRDRGRLAMAALALVGLFLALGRFNLVSHLLALVPPFNLFRAPARWLFLFTFGASMLIGFGVDGLGRRGASRVSTTLAWGLPAVLMAWSLAAAGITAPGETGPLGQPSRLEWYGWALGLAGLAGILIVAHRPSPTVLRWTPPATLALVSLELFVASRPLAYNHPTFPEAYFGIRPAMTQLLAARSESTPPGRFLSMSALRFNPGDLDELLSAWNGQLPPDAVYEAVVAIKAKEVLSPNLPLAWRIPSVDGFDGGILPLAEYAGFEALLLPPGPIPPDGRLRENLTEAPPNAVLQITNTRYLITDKTDDTWIDGVYYDRQFTLDAAPGRPAALDRLPDFTATAIGLIVTADPGGPASLGEVRVRLATGDELGLPLPAPDAKTGLAKVLLTEPSRLKSIEVRTGDRRLEIGGAALIDERSGAFHTVTLGPYRLVHSGDVKIYENLNLLPRAYWVGDAEIAASDEAALERLSSGELDLSRTVVLSSGTALAQPDSAGTADAYAYEPERVAIRTDSAFPGYAVLSDAYYPGWEATVDGQPATIERANLMFRAVAVPAGRHTVEFRYRPRTFVAGLVVGGWAIGLLAIGYWLLGDRSIGRLVNCPSPISNLQ